MWLVCEYHYTRAECLRLNKFEFLLLALTMKKPLPVSYDNGEDHETVFINEILLHERVNELNATKDQYVLTRLLFQSGNFLPTWSLMRVAFHSASCNVVVGTYLGILFILSPYAPVPVTPGQPAASLDRLCAPEGVHRWQKAHRIYIFVILHSEIEQSTCGFSTTPSIAMSIEATIFLTFFS